MSKYLIVSTAVTDEIHKHGHPDVQYALGGAGVYALVGAKVWIDDLSILTGVGEDFSSLHLEWFKNNNLSTANLMVKDPHTPKTIIQYEDEDHRTETPFYGAEHYQKMNAGVSDIAEALTKDTMGIYVFKTHDEVFWEELLQLKNQRDFKILWELNADSASFEYLSKVKKIAEQIDVLSLNRTEAQSLFGVMDTETIINNLQGWDINTVFLRAGSEGAYMITKNSTLKIKSVEQVRVVDVTGGGNSSSAAVLIGYCEGRSLEEMGLMGSISAAICIEQEGVPKIIDKHIRVKAVEILQRMMGKGE